MSDVDYMCAKCGRELTTKVLDTDKSGQMEVILYSCPIHGERVIIRWDE